VPHNSSDTWPDQPALQRHSKNPCELSAVDAGLI
jgi:hypothetical protein